MVTGTNQQPAQGMFSGIAQAVGNAVQGVQGAAKAAPNALAWNRVRNGDAHTVRDAQEFLASHGYHPGGIDGIWGPHTARALRNYLNKVHPNAHNAQVRAVQSKHPQTGRFQPQNAPAKPMKGGKGGGRGGRGGGGGGGGGGGNVPAGGNGVFNPKKQAQGMANAEYNPAINSLKQALLDLATQGKYDEGQIKGWYKQMKGQIGSQQAGQAAAGQAEQQNLVQNIGNDAQLFGASNAQQMQPAVGNATGLLSTENQSQQDYLNNMKPLLDAQAAQGNQNIDQLVMAQQKNYNDQLTQQQQAKGSAYNADYQQALQDQVTQQQNQLALQQAQAMMPYQISSAKSQARADRANANAAGAYNQARIRAQNASANASQARVAVSNSEVQKNMAEARKAAMSGKANVLAPGSTSYDRISKSLYRSMTNSTGKITIPDPRRAQHAIFAQAVSSGLIDRNGRPLVKGAIKLLNNTLVEMYNRDAAWQKGYKWNGRQFVPR